MSPSRPGLGTIPQSPHPINRQRYPLGPEIKPVTKELRVTVCIGGICDHGRSIVAVSDNKVSFQDFSAEHMSYKNQPLGNQWTVMSSGNDASHVQPIIEKAEEELEALASRQRKLPKSQRRPLRHREVADVVNGACHWQLLREIERSVLGRYGISVEEFAKRGKDYFTELEHAELCRRIEQADLAGLTLLLAGYDAKKRAHLWVVDGLSAPRNFDRLGVYAIGSGARAALSSIAFHTSREHVKFGHSEMERCAYFALAAKFTAESAPDVGLSTFAIALRPRGVNRTLEVSWLSVDSVRDAWEKDGAPRSPEEFIRDEMHTMFSEFL